MGPDRIPTRVCELLVGQPDVAVLSVIDHRDGPLEIHVGSVEIDGTYVGWVKDHTAIGLVDLRRFGRPTDLVWHSEAGRIGRGSCCEEYPMRSEHDRLKMCSSAFPIYTAEIGRSISFGRKFGSTSLNASNLSAGSVFHHRSAALSAGGSRTERFQQSGEVRTHRNARCLWPRHCQRNTPHI